MIKKCKGRREVTFPGPQVHLADHFHPPHFAQPPPPSSPSSHPFSPLCLASLEICSSQTFQCLPLLTSNSVACHSLEHKLLQMLFLSTRPPQQLGRSWGQSKPERHFQFPSCSTPP